MPRFATYFSLAAALAGALALGALPAHAQEVAREGIHVQGDWVIEVRNPDGSVADRREFSNDLVAPEILAYASGE